MKLEEAKRRIGVPELWRHFGYQGDPKPSCKCPWRDEKKPSFSVDPGGKLWHDFATAEGGDAIDFLSRASGLRVHAKTNSGFVLGRVCSSNWVG